MAIQFDDLLDALEATPAILEHHPSAVEVMDRFILDNTKQNAVARPPAADVHRRRSGGALCASSSTPTGPRICRRGSMRSSAICGRARFGYRYHRALDLPAQARIWSLREAALGLSMAMKDDAKSLSFVEDTAVAPERLRDYIERFLGIVARHGTHRGRLRPCVGGLPARAARGQPEDR